MEDGRMDHFQSVPSPAHPLLTTSEAAQALALHPRTIRRLVAEGELAPVRFGRAVRFRPSDLTELVERRSEGG